MNDPTVVEHSSSRTADENDPAIIEISDDSLDECFQVKEPGISAGGCWDLDSLSGIKTEKSDDTPMPIADVISSLSDIAVAVDKDIKENARKEFEDNENVDKDDSTPPDACCSETSAESNPSTNILTSELMISDVMKEGDDTDIVGMKANCDSSPQNSIEKVEDSGLNPMEISAIDPVEVRLPNSSEETDFNSEDRLVIDETGASSSSSADGLMMLENGKENCEEVMNVNNGYHSVSPTSLDTAKRKLDEEHSLEIIDDNTLTPNQKAGNNAIITKSGVKRFRPLNVEIEAIEKALNLNWKREIVVRATTTPNKRAADVYYKSPVGKKLRSLPEVENYLLATHDTTVSLDWFSFRKEKFTNHPNETERHAFAKRSSIASHDGQMETPVKKIKNPSVVKQTKTKPKTTTPTIVETDLNPMLPVQKSKNSSGVKQTKTKPKITTPTIVTTDLNPMCSDKCKGYEGHLPDLMCVSCYCLFHPRCVGIFSGDEQSDFTCKNCTRERNVRDTNFTHHFLPKSTTKPNGDLHRGEHISSSQNESLSTKKRRSKTKLKSGTTVLVHPDGIDQRKGAGPSNVVIRTPSSAPVLSSGTHVLHSGFSAVFDGQTDQNLIMKIGNFVVQGPSSVSVIPISTSSDMTANTEKDAQRSTISSVLRMELNGSAKQLLTPVDARKQKTPQKNNIGSPNHAISQPTTEPNSDWSELPNNILLQIFEHLHTVDLFRAKRTCSTWNKVASNPCLWRHVYLQDVKVANWEKFADFVQTKGVEFLNMRGMKFLQDSSTMWKDFNAAIPKFNSLSGIMLCKAPASIMYRIASKLDKLTYFVSEGIFDPKPEIPNKLRCKLFIGKFLKMTELRNFRLRGIYGLYVPQSVCFGGFNNLNTLTHLQELALTSFTETRASDLEFLNQLPSLSTLELGDCSDWSDEHFANVGCLSGLKKLRLEYGGVLLEYGGDSALCRALQNLTRLVQLELVLFPIPAEFGEVLSKLKDLQTLIVWPEMKVDGAQNSQRIITALEKVPQLKKFVWGLVAPDINKRLVADRKVNDKFSCIPFFSKHLNVNTGKSDLIETSISASQLMEQVRSVLPLSMIRVVMISNSSYTSVRQAVK